MSDNKTIDKLKNNWTAWGGLSDEERECLLEHKGSVVRAVGGNSFCKVTDVGINPLGVYRISPDFQPEKKRWFFDLHNQVVFSHGKDEVGSFGASIEVQESELPYLEKPEGEWVFKVPVKGDIQISNETGTETTHEYSCNDFTSFLQGYRWVKVAEAPRFVEYPVYINGGHYMCEIEHTEATLYLLSELPSIVGFAGVQFKGGHPDEWSMSISQTVSGYSSTNDPKQKPATPIKARFYVKGVYGYGRSTWTGG